MNIPTLAKWAGEQKELINLKKDNYEDLNKLDMWAHFKMINDQGLEIIKFEKDIQQRKNQISTSLTFLDKQGAKIPNETSGQSQQPNRNNPLA